MFSFVGEELETRSAVLDVLVASVLVQRQHSCMQKLGPGLKTLTKLSLRRGHVILVRGYTLF